MTPNMLGPNGELLLPYHGNHNGQNLPVPGSEYQHQLVQNGIVPYGNPSL